MMDTDQEKARKFLPLEISILEAGIMIGNMATVCSTGQMGNYIAEKYDCCWST